MSSSFRWVTSLALLLFFASQLWADLCIGGGFRRQDRILPGRQADPEFDFVIMQDANIKQAELRIPRRMLVAEAGTDGISTRHAVAGLALSAAVVGAGLWCLRFHGTQIPRKKLAVAGVMALLLLGGLTMGGFVDAKTAPQYFPPVPTLLTLPNGIEVIVQIVPGGDEVQLHLPPELADKIGLR